MRVEFLDEAWARAWCEALNASAAFAAAATRWRGGIGIVMTAQRGSRAAARAVLAEVERGVCRSARVVPAATAMRARRALEAAPETWRRVLDGSLDPVQAVLGGSLRLARGSLLSIMPHLDLARELLVAARSVPAAFPGQASDSV